MYTINELQELMTKKPEQASFDNGCSIYFDSFDNEYFFIVTPDQKREIKRYRDTSPEDLLQILNQWQHGFSH
ncbi:MAG TPA: hypothetical protein VLA24_01790 [Pseudomonadales bacterium]|nr:hypothetical protein [Pseudomonadales bacterium]